MFRHESDSLGTKEVPDGALFGIQTARAIENFAISGTPIGSHAPFIKALATVKRCCALANFECGFLPPNKYEAIAYACDQIIAGQCLDQFPIDVIQGGAGTSTNMNVNEVIANLALIKIGQKPGSYGIINPNDDVNKSQSTNDVYPTAVRLTCLRLNQGLIDALIMLCDSFEQKAAEFFNIPKLARTQLQDAVPMTLGQEFSAFATVLSEDVVCLQRLGDNFLEINLGGTAIGTRLNATPLYASHAISALGKITGFPFRASPNLIEATWDCGAFVLYSGMLKCTATKLSKIANDLRLLSSGPRGGFGEINLPRRQPGSSIMPGKINPVIPELVNQVAFAVIGNDLTITLAAEAGQLQLNAMAPILVHKTFESISWLTRAIHAFAALCIDGIAANKDVCQQHLTSSAALVTALVPTLGYQVATEVAKLMIENNLSFDSALSQKAPNVHR